jgi:hypothetical protein
MFMQWGTRLGEAFAALEATSNSLAQCLRADLALPMLLPSFTDSTDPLARREAVIASLTRLFREDGKGVPLEAGLVCASTATLAAAHALNHAKAAFKCAILELREEINRRYENLGHNLRIDHLLNRALARECDIRRQEELSIVLGNLDLRRLDLIACYTHVRVLEPHLQSIAWTWARTRYSGERVTHEEALKMAEALQGQEKVQAIQVLSRFPGNATFMQVKSLPTVQLRANLVFRDLVPPRKSISIAGPILTPDTCLPRYVWRDKPEDGKSAIRLKRSDAQISDRALVAALKLHHYVNGENAFTDETPPAMSTD